MAGRARSTTVGGRWITGHRQAGIASFGHQGEGAMSAQATISRPLGRHLRVGPFGITLIVIAGVLGGLGLSMGMGLQPLKQPAIEAQAPVFHVWRAAGNGVPTPVVRRSGGGPAGHR
jgi:hypothetical protein